MIERSLLEGEAYISIAERTGLGRMALARHKRDHSPIWLAKMTEATGPSAGSIRERIEALISRIESVMADAESARRHTVVLSAARELRAALETVARISGELDERPSIVIDIAASDQWHQVRTALYQALRRHPEAIADVREVFGRLALE